MTHYAVGWSGGKDSTLALDRARRRGLEVSHLFNIYEGSTGRVRFHGVRHQLIQRQAEALGVRLVQDHTHPDDFETVFHRVLGTLKERRVGGVIFGNIHLADIRAWFEERTSGYGLEHVEPLWGDEPELIVREFIERGYVATIVGIDLSRSKPEWLGSRFDHTFLREIREAHDVDLCGERGEYHSFVYDGPLFQERVTFERGAQHEFEGHRFMDLKAE